MSVAVGTEIRCLNCDGRGYTAQEWARYIHGRGKVREPRLCPGCGGTGKQKVKPS